MPTPSHTQAIIEDQLLTSPRPGYPAKEVSREVVLDTIANWQSKGIRSIICLLTEQQLEAYRELPEGLLSTYREAGFAVVHIPVDATTNPAMGEEPLKQLCRAWPELSQPVLMHADSSVEPTSAPVRALAAPDAFGIRGVDNVPPAEHPRNRIQSARSGNALHVIQPYRSADTWVFDDPSVGLEKEPFVVGIPEIIDHLVTDIPNASKGFRLIFSDRPFPGTQHTMVRLREDFDGAWYALNDSNQEGWLCPALYHYFESTPEEIHFRAEASAAANP
jgi:protein tyrosine phosphatase (PTP) superfamily phosphohydrolase (DUF442 family)